MNLSGFKKIAIAAVAIIGLLLILIFKNGFGTPFKATGQAPSVVSNSAQAEYAEVVSTKPQLKDSPVILPNQIIEITFNLPLENIGEFKHRIDDFKDYKAELSNDKKTVLIIPVKPFELGKSYTIFISKESKFDGKKRLRDSTHFTFHTIEYRGV